MTKRRVAGKTKSSNANTSRKQASTGSKNTKPEVPPEPDYVLRDDENSPVNDTLPLYFPSTQIAFKLLLCSGFTSAVWMYITDCDETFNYWEPSHYLIFGKGFQTWEYDPQFALRSYMYLLLHSVPAWFYYSTLQPSRLLMFYFLRCVLAVIYTICAVYFYKSVCREFGVNIGRMMIVFMVFSPGIFISSTAYLPSSFSMYMTMLSIGAWYQRRYELAILSTAFSTFMSWPFAAIIGAPIAFDILFRLKKAKMLLFWSVVSVLAFLVFQVEIDSSYYGKFVIAPWNIIKYNLFTSHGPNLYGSEPWYFYFLNGFLNFNFAFILALFTPLLLVFVRLFVTKRVRHKQCLPYELSLISFYVWFIIFLLQSHKASTYYLSNFFHYANMGDVVV